MPDEQLWSTRLIAEYAYCPRLFYLEQVEGIDIPSADTAEGDYIHRRVAHPGQPLPDDAETPKKVSSLTITSRELGLTATIDLTEISGHNAVPVEYRRGRPRKLSTASETTAENGGERQVVEPWPTDRIQIGLQCLLLEEHGYKVESGIIYYAAEKRRLEIKWGSNLRAEALSTLKEAQACAGGPRPPPLLNSHKCPRCSLQPFCLPDEINYERPIGAPEDTSPRRIWPPREDGIQVIVQQEGTRLGIAGKCIKIEEGNGKLLKEIPITSVESLTLVGYVQISTQALHRLASRGIPIAYLSSSGRLVAMVDPLDSVSANVRRSQIKILEQPSKCLELASALVSSKILNQRTILMRNHPNLPDGVAEDLLGSARVAGEAASIESVRGAEGQAAAVYFAHFHGLLKEPFATLFRKNGRRRRPPPDPANCCLSMAYTMLTHECTAALRLARLEPSIGIFHVSRPGRPALSLDLMEPFRPLIADSITLMALNRGELTEGHFQSTAAGCLLTDTGRRIFFDLYNRRMETEITHPVFKYRLSYRRMLTLHSRMISAWMVGDISSLSFLTTR